MIQNQHAYLLFGGHFCSDVCFLIPVCQEGFILGESRVDEQVTISDSQSDHIHIEEVYSKFPCPSVLYSPLNFNVNMS